MVLHETKAIFANNGKNKIPSNILRCGWDRHIMVLDDRYLHVCGDWSNRSFPSAHISGTAIIPTMISY